MRIHNCAVFSAVIAAAVVLAMMPAAFAQDQTGATYMGVNTCKVCHNKAETGAQYTKWKSMKHSSAFEVLKSDKALEVAKKAGLTTPPSESPECLQCHVTAYDVATKAVPAKISMEDGVQCEACHGPASLHVADGKKLKLNKDSGVDIAAHITVPKADVCVKCHNDKNPTWNPERYTTKDGKKVGFDFEQASKIIAHPDPMLHKEAAAK
jgi:ssDNA-binding Zn-finger/Zn-ribbon topoisomerase 1